jgi:hypothetical protein
MLLGMIEEFVLHAAKEPEPHAGDQYVISYHGDALDWDITRGGVSADVQLAK